MNKYQETLDFVKSLHSNASQQEINFRVLEDIVQELIEKANKYDEKETPKKPLIEFEDLDYEQSKFGCDYYVCPNCDSTLYEDTEHLEINNYTDNFNQDIKYCHCCGQKLDWKDEI